MTLAACLLAASVTGSGAEIMAGFGPVHHPITTSSPEAQRFFDQGLALAYGFNHEEAIRSFERAAELDPRAAMPLWGIALALGPNINLDVDPEREKKAFDASRKALELAAGAPANEQAYVRAVARRYSVDPKADLKALAEEYVKAMQELVRACPDDLDAATLYAESLMDLRPWKLWKQDGTPEPGTEEILSVLESVLKRNPGHLGANHYYIHAIEGSPHPERALPSAARLETLAPASGHLVHMPAHIYMRTGDYARAEDANQKAAEADRSYIARTHAEGIYPLMYYNHNLQFLAAAAMMDGRREIARKAADELASNTAPVAREMPMAEFVVPMPMFVALRFGSWNEVLAMPDPGPGLPLTGAAWHFARARAFQETGNRAGAQKERAAFLEAKSKVPADEPWGNNMAADVLAVAEESLAACFESGSDARIARWKSAIARQDALVYDEPPAWYYPVRESLGKALLDAGRAAEAEAVYRADLERNPRSPRSLLGLKAALEAQHRAQDARSVDTQYRAAAGEVAEAVFRAGP
jgi:tetratricopeptide (TPR) repeat protein